MAYVAVNKDGSELVSSHQIRRAVINYKEQGYWWRKVFTDPNDQIILPKGSIEKLIGKKLTWEDEPVELKELTKEKYIPHRGIGHR
jgi:hypothetical protein